MKEVRTMSGEEKNLGDTLGSTPTVEGLQQFAEFSAYMFYFLANKMLEKLGTEAGSEAVKEAITEFGRFRGEKVREKVLAAGLEPTMDNEYMFHDLPIGSAIWDASSRMDGDVKVSEIRRCPFGNVWKEMKADHIGKLYCPIDYAIWEGYNPDIRYSCDRCIFDGDPTCVMSYQVKKAETDEKK